VLFPPNLKGSAMTTLAKVLGPAGTFGHEVALASKEALQETYGDIRIDFVRDNAEILLAAAYLRCIGFVPIYNKDAKLVEGVVRFWLREHRGFKSYLIGVKKLRVRQHLWTHSSISRPRRQIRGVMSHPHAILQTKNVANELRLRVLRETSSTAEAARLVASGNKWRNAAAIASELAGNVYGLKLWRPNVEDSPDNFTLFHVFGPRPTEPTKRDRTDVIVINDERPDRLRRELLAIRSEHPNMRRVREIFGERSSVAAYYCRFDGHRDTDIGRRILSDMRRFGDVLVLGSYPIE
jgi:chorismate mutase/prephenate dehydratase